MLHPISARFKSFSIFRSWVLSRRDAKHRTVSRSRKATGGRKQPCIAVAHMIAQV
jgi:hypothetical protein